MEVNGMNVQLKLRWKIPEKEEKMKTNQNDVKTRIKSQNERISNKFEC